MTIPTATYRLQLRGGMDFAKARSLLPYWKRLGISHLYLSPIFSAASGSTHGYDAVSFSEIEPDLGGRDGFEALAREARANDMRLLVDFVPNHMAANPQNAWWRDVLQWGGDSAFSTHFDVDWSAPKLIVPVLGDAYGETLAAGKFQLKFERAVGEFSVTYAGLSLPLKPSTYALILSRMEHAKAAELSLRLASSDPSSSAHVIAELTAAMDDDVFAQDLDAALVAINGDAASLHDVLEAQIWRLAHWRASRESLTYRRFFEISDLVGVRVEHPAVFDNVHRVVLELMTAGLIDGLRIDHIDGLADPLSYLRRLREAMPNEQAYLVVEKILGHHEDVRPNWPIAGTTGYESINALSRLLVAPEGLRRLDQSYRAIADQANTFEEQTLALKRRTMTRNLAGELDMLTGQAADIAAADLATRDLGRDTLRRAIVELASHMTVYRTYVDAGGPDEADRSVIEAARQAAIASREVEDELAVDFIVTLLTLDLPDPARRLGAIAFVTRFQQTTGPLMAKAVEDTQFYRYNRLIALNEVGDEPVLEDGSVANFHERMTRRQRTTPLSLSTTATHDTKRGEDARARLYALGEWADEWAQAVSRWDDVLGIASPEGDPAVVGRETSWLFYQALLGAMPEQASGTDALGDLGDRLIAFMQKAAREAKLQTSWTMPAEDYEAMIASFVRNSLDPARSGIFFDDFAATAKPIIAAGEILSLSQLALKLFGPGIPDIYQGTELWDLSLVDPDNRRPVDFAHRLALIEQSANHTGDSGGAQRKFALMRNGLAVRQRLDLSSAEYVPLTVSGPAEESLVAFARARQEQGIVVIAARRCRAIVETARASAMWNQSRVTLPPAAVSGSLLNVGSTQRVRIEDQRIDLSTVLGADTVAILEWGATSTS